MNQEYIHINEAVKKWDKTRQTFYNYMHKGLVRTKKINNKVYLYHDDIEQLMNGQLPDFVEPELIEETSEAQDEHVPLVLETREKHTTGDQQLLKNIQDDMTRLHKQYYTMKDDILYEVKRTRDDVLFDSQRLSKSVEQQVSYRMEKIKDEERTFRLDVMDTVEDLQVLEKKQNFWIAYCSIVAINLVIMMFM